MKKAIVFVILIALFCALLCGCTPPETKTDQSEQSMELPELQTGENQVRNTQSGEDGSDTPAPDTAGPVAGAPTAPVNNTVPEIIDDPEIETISDYVVDGGDGFGFGGN